MMIIINVSLPAPPYLFSPSSLGFVYISPLIGTIIGAVIGGYACDKCIDILSRRNHNGIFEPEFRLIWLLPLFLFAPAELLLFGFGFGDSNWIVPVAGFGICTTLLSFETWSDNSHACPHCGSNRRNNICYRFLPGLHKRCDDYIEHLPELYLCQFHIFHITYGWTYGCKVCLPSLFWRWWQMFCILTGIEVAIFLMTIPMIIYGKRFRVWTSKSYWEEEANAERVRVSLAGNGSFMHLY